MSRHHDCFAWFYKYGIFAARLYMEMVTVLPCRTPKFQRTGTAYMNIEWSMILVQNEDMMMSWNSNLGKVKGNFIAHLAVDHWEENACVRILSM